MSYKNYEKFMSKRDESYEELRKVDKVSYRKLEVEEILRRYEILKKYDEGVEILLDMIMDYVDDINNKRNDVCYNDIMNILLYLKNGE